MRVARAQVNAEAKYATIQLTLQTSQSAVVPATPSRFDDAVDRAVGILAVEAMVVLYRSSSSGRWRCWPSSPGSAGAACGGARRSSCSRRRRAAATTTP